MANPTTFTPGPWTLETVPTSCGVCHKVGPFPPRRNDESPRHACLYCDYPSPGNPADDELLANARLIAAAPELYEALCDLVDRCGPIVDGLSYDHDPHQYSSVLVDSLLLIKRAMEDAIQGLAKARGESA